MKKLGLIFLTCVSLVLTLPTFSLDVRFLAESPSQFFNDADWKMFNNASEKALDSTPNGKVVTWRNPQTEHGGSFQPLTTTNKNGLTCRKLRISNYANHQTGDYTFTFCKYPSGWKIPPVEN